MLSPLWLVQRERKKEQITRIKEEVGKERKRENETGTGLVEEW